MSGFSFKKLFNDTANRTISKIKGQDNPSYYQAPSGFIKYDLPLPTDIDINIIEFTNYIQSIIPNNRDNAIRLYSLLQPNEQVLYAINGTIKQNYLIVITSFNRVIFTSKESYKILKKEEINSCSIQSTGVLGIDFVINDIVFLGGNEKDLIYNFLKILQNKKDDEDVKLIENSNIKRELNFVELIKLNTLNKMVPNKQEINKILISLLKQDELILTAIYGNTNYKNYVLTITSDKNLYMVSNEDHLILPLSSIKTHECVKKGILTLEFVINNFYFINGGSKDNAEIFFNLFDDVYFNKVRDLIISNTKELVEFDFTVSINLLTSDYHGFIINEQTNKMIVVNGLQDLNILNFKDIIRYELPRNFYLESDNYETKTNTELFNVYNDINEITRNSNPTEDIILTLHTRLTTKKEINIEFIKDVLFDNSLNKEKYEVTLNLVQKIIDFLDKILARTSYQKIAQIQIARESAYEELRKLKKLLDDGIISEEDYEKKKKEILNIR